MSKLFVYLLMLANQKFWGEVRLAFKDGKLTVVQIEQQYVEGTLPEPPAAARAAYERKVQDELKGVESRL